MAPSSVEEIRPSPLESNLLKTRLSSEVIEVGSADVGEEGEEVKVVPDPVPDPEPDRDPASERVSVRLRRRNSDLILPIAGEKKDQKAEISREGSRIERQFANFGADIYRTRAA